MQTISVPTNENPTPEQVGSTLLQGDAPRNFFVRWLMAVYNAKGIFSNHDDRLADLEQTLRQQFRAVSIEIVGCAALFSAHF